MGHTRGWQKIGQGKKIFFVPNLSQSCCFCSPIPFQPWHWQVLLCWPKGPILPSHSEYCLRGHGIAPNKVDGHFPVKQKPTARVKDTGKCLWMDIDKHISFLWKNRNVIKRKSLEISECVTTGVSGLEKAFPHHFLPVSHSIPGPPGQTWVDR